MSKGSDRPQAPRKGQQEGGKRLSEGTRQDVVQITPVQPVDKVETKPDRPPVDPPPRPNN